MSFHKSHIKCNLGGIQMTKSVPCASDVAEIQDDGSVLTRHIVEEKPLEVIADELSAIRPQDYTLKNLIKAGVPLDRINVNGLLDKADKSNIEEDLTNISNATFDKLLEEEYKLEVAKSSKTEQVEKIDE